MPTLSRLAALVALLAPLTAQSYPSVPRLLLDFNRDPREIRSSSPGDFASTGVLAYFSADDGIHGRELWRSLGTSATTALVADVRAGYESSDPRSIMPIATGAVFLADDGGGLRLFSTDGMPGSATALLPSGSRFVRVIAAESLGARAVFFADDGVHGVELWSTDGTPSGTAPMRGLVSGIGVLGAPLVNWMRTVRREANGETSVVFSVPASGVLLLYRSDGTAAGTRLLAPLPQGINPAIGPACTLPGGPTLFVRTPSLTSTPNWSLWTTDGTVAGTGLVADLGFVVDPFVLPIAFDGRAWFGGDVGRFAMSTDGTAGGTRSHTPPGAAGQRVSCFLGVAAGSLWCLGGTRSGLVRFDRGATEGVVVPLATQIPSGEYQLQLGERFVHYSSVAGRLWAIDVRSASVVELAIGFGNLPFAHAKLGSRALIRYGSRLGLELGVTDGTPLGTTLVANLNDETGLVPNASSWVADFASFRGRALFAPMEGRAGSRPWTSDGTSANTALLFPEVASAWGFVETAGGVFLVMTDTLGVSRLGFSDGTAAGTRVIPSSVPGSTPGRIEALVTLGSRAVFAGYDGATSRLWASDGLVSWPLPVLVPFDRGNVALIPVGERVIARVLHPTNDPYVMSCEIWTTDGSVAGTARGTTLQAPNYQEPPVVFADRIWFTAYESPGQETLWTSDGTAEGTMPYLRGGLRPTPGWMHLAVGPTKLWVIGAGALWAVDGRGGYERIASVPAQYGLRLAAIGDRLLLWPNNATALWSSDGTAAGTRPIASLVAPHRSAGFTPLGARGALFPAYPTGGAPSLESLWFTDGTPQGTRALAALRSNTPGRVRGGRAYLVLEDPFAGFETHVLTPGASSEVVQRGCGGPRAPDLVALDDPVLGTSMRLHGRSSAGAIAVLMLSLVPPSPPAPIAPSPCSFAVDPTAFATAPPIGLVNGGFSLAMPIPGDPVLRDLSIVLQFAAGPSDATLGADLSSGLRLNLGQ
ncbi:MAG: hypothetical protein HZB39_14545 [Planctomycetes bacterium]|nr:hypothetical protein [Planctomycetota bacterium]